MKPAARRIVLIPVLLVLLAVLLWLLGGLWLEGSGGRALLERELGRRIGMPVHLRGNFDLMFYPAFGVSGSGFVIGEEMEDSPPLFSSRGYEVSVALVPLLNGEMLVEWIRVSDGVLKLEAFDAPLAIRSLTVQDFAEGRPAPFRLELSEIGVIDGIFLWEPSRQSVQFPDLNLETGGGAMHGLGCVFFTSPLAVHLDLAARSLDLNALAESLPSLTDTGSDEAEGPVDLHVRITAAELHASGVVARETEFILGEVPDCAGDAKH